MIIFCFIIGVVVLILLEKTTDYSDKIISLYILVDNDHRIIYTGSKEDCQKQLTKDLKLIKLEGMI